MTSTSFITGTGLKKCMPMTCSGRLVWAASLVIEMDEVFDARMTCAGRRVSSSREDLALDLEFLSCRFDDEVAAGKRGAVDGALNAADRGVHLVLGELGFGDFAGEILADGVEAAIEETLLDFAEADIESAAREDVGDAVTHGAGAQYTDGRDLTHCSPCFRKAQNR